MFTETRRAAKKSEIPVPSQVYNQNYNGPQYLAGANQQTLIQTSDVIRRAWVSIAQKITVSGGNNTVANTLPGDDLAGMNFQIKANAADTLMDLPGTALWEINKWMLSKNQLLYPNVNTNLGDGTTANPSLFTSLELPIFGCPRNARASDTWLYANPLRNLTFYSRFATSAASINGSATGYTATPNLTYQLETASPGLSTKVNPQTNAPNIILPGYGSRWLQLTQVFSGSGNNQQIQLPTGYLGYARILIQATTTASPPVDTGGLITNIQIKNGTQTLWDIPENTLFQICQDGGYRGQPQTTAGIAYNASGRISASSSNSGWYMIDFLSDGRLEESIVTAGNTNLIINLNLSGGATINVYYNQILKLVNGNPSP